MNPVTHCIGGWVNPRAGLGVLEDRKVFTSTSIRTQNRPVRSLVVILTTQFLFCNMKNTFLFKSIMSHYCEVFQ